MLSVEYMRTLRPSPLVTREGSLRIPVTQAGVEVGLETNAVLSLLHVRTDVECGNGEETLFFDRALQLYRRTRIPDESKML